MNPEVRLARVLERLSRFGRVVAMRGYDSERAERNGEGRDSGLMEAVTRLEAAADGLWATVEKR
jgi:hypothetical protein